MSQMEEREAITFNNQGQKIFAVLHRPLNLKNCPAIVICPGFAGTKCGKFRLFVRLGKLLASQGIAVLRFDYRGSGDSEGEFNDMTIDGKVSDALVALEFLANDPQIDKNRMGLLGRSLGGMISVLTASRFKNIKSLVLWAPVFNSDPWQKLWEAFKRQQAQGKSQEGALRLPSNVPNMQFLKQFFNIRIQEEMAQLKELPLLHIHGEKDEVVQIDHAEGYKQVRDVEEITRFIRLAKSDHDFSDVDEQNIILSETCQWYKKTL